MEGQIAQVASAMICLYAKDPPRIQHFMKVYAFAAAIAAEEQVNSKMKQIIEVAALVHDIGIHAAEKKYHSSAGNYQEQEGPAIAKAMLLELGFAEPFVERVCYLVGHHHTYDPIDGIDHQILIEADFLVNAYEDGMKSRAIIGFRDAYFKTVSGIQYLNEMFGLS